MGYIFNIDKQNLEGAEILCEVMSQDTTSVKLNTACSDKNIGTITLVGATFPDGTNSCIGSYSGSINLLQSNFSVIFSHPKNITELGNGKGPVLGSGEWLAPIKIINPKVLEEFENLKQLNLYGSGIIKSGSNLRFNKLANLEYLNLSFPFINNNEIIKLPKLTAVRLYGVRLLFDLTVCKNLKTVEKAEMLKPWQQLSELSTSLVKLELLNNAGSVFRGTTEDLSKFTSLTYLSLGKSMIIGDIRNLPPQITTFIAGNSFDLDYSKVNGDKILDTITTWNSENIKMDSDVLDNLIISISKSTLTSKSVITLNGIRTSASDSAVEVIQNTGATLNIIN